ncbi:MAG TPA: TlpA disulfide reductase family protein [Bacteroidia bacterium]|nr:TlpA disulfide reductase family protein [Bacteroidia bacterium]
MNIRWSAALAFLILAFIAFYIYQRNSGTPALSVNDFELRTLEGQKFDWDTLRGQKTILCLGASWCVSCVEELRDLVFLKTGSLKDVNVVVISDETEMRIRHFRDKGQYPFLFLRSEKRFESMNIYSIPVTLLLNRRLNVVKERSGSFNWSDPSTAEHLLKIME